MLLASDIGLSRGAVIIILTVLEPTGAAMDAKCCAAPAVQAKLKRRGEHKKGSHIFQPCKDDCGVPQVNGSLEMKKYGHDARRLFHLNYSQCLRGKLCKMTRLSA